MALRKPLILRKLRSSCLEGRTVLIQRIVNFLTASNEGIPADLETPHQSNEPALHLDTVGPEDSGFISLVGRFQRDRGAAAPQPL